MRDLTIIIPAKNEEIHIERSVKSALTLTDNVFVIDSNSTDRTVEIAEGLGAKVFQYNWTSSSTFSKKMNWAIENTPIKTKWAMRLDADEYLVGNWVDKIDDILLNMDDDVNVCSINRRLYFLGKWMKHGDNWSQAMRIIRVGHALYENRWLDEYVDLQGGKSVMLDLEIADNPNITISQWINKHNDYSLKEALTAIDNEVGIMTTQQIIDLDENAIKIKKKKNNYYRIAPYWRAFFYFCYRYFVRFGFLNGQKGFLWDFYQAWWYRTLVDIKIQEIYSICGKSPDRIREYVKKQYNLEL